MAACLIGVTATAAAQDLNTAYYTRDYMYRHNMNPAFANDHGYVAIPVLGNINVSMQSNFGYEAIFHKNPLYGTVEGAKKTTTFMNPYISNDDALKKFSKGTNRLTASFEMPIISVGFKGFGGYNTVELASRTNLGMSLPYDLFAFAKNTGNECYEIGNIDMMAQSYVELAVGHSRDINEKLRVGAKAKVLLGVGRADLKIKDMKADLSQSDKWTLTAGKIEANASMSGFSFENEEKEYNSSDEKYDRVDDINIDGGGLAGFGLAFDFGAIYKINDDWTVNAAVKDLGFIKWTKTQQATSTTNSFEFEGFHDVSVTSGSDNTIDDQLDKYGDQLSDFVNLHDDGEVGGRTTGIGATVNLGATYNLPVYRKMTFGALSTTHINGAYSWTEGRLSANWEPLKWLDGGVSFAVNSYTTSFGWVLNIHPSGLNIFLATDHILGKVSKEGIPLSGNANVALGMNITF